MKKIIVVTIIILSVILFFLLIGKQPKDMKALMKLKNPVIITMEDQLMLVLEAKGDPKQTAKNAIPALFKAFFILKREKQSLKLVSPKARLLDKPKPEWTGLFGLPISEPFDTLPASFATDFPDIKLVTWSYGQVAQILHVGPYSKIKETLDRLNLFIQKKGYISSGTHEEDYVKGPDMFLKGNPEKYLTVIRLFIKKVD